MLPSPFPAHHSMLVSSSYQHKLATGRVHVVLVHGLLQVSAGIPQVNLAVAHLGRTSRGNEATAAAKDGAGSLDTVVGVKLLHGIRDARVKDADLLVLAGSDHLRAVKIPLGGLNDVSVALLGEHALARLDIPRLHHV